jgi:hypothetical protein
MKEKIGYQLPLVAVIYFDNNDIVTASTIIDYDDGKVTDQDWND